MNNSKQTNVKCDYLSLSYSPEDSPTEEVKAEILQCGATVSFSTDRKTVLTGATGGTCAIEARRGFHYVSLSGATLEHLRNIGRYDSMLSLLASSPHKVTRLDAAHDVPIDAPELLAELIAASPDGKATLTRKAVQLKEIMGVRDDGKRSGSLYYGYRSRARVTARVYDKQLQMQEVHDKSIAPCTRYEITVKDGQATLNDAYNPTAIFWHFASPVLLPAPTPAPATWKPGGDLIGWTYKKHEVLPVEQLEKYIDKIMPTLTELSGAVGTYGNETVLHLIAKRLGVELPNRGH